MACGSKEPAPRPKGRETLILSSEYDDRRAGREAARGVAAELGLVEDPTLESWVQGIGARLVRHARDRPFDYKFSIVDQSEPNAFALPGGYIYLSRGLLALANTEDELANVIGHEITHASERHAAAQQEIARRQSPFVMPLLRMAKIAAYGREQERAADRGGQTLAAASGYDPMAMAHFLRRLGGGERIARGYSRLPSFFDTHPGPIERAASCSARAQDMSWERSPETSAPPHAYLGRIDGITLGPNPAEGVFRGTRFLHADLDFHLLFPEGWELTNSTRAVGATSPDGNARVFLAAEAGEDDPQIAAEQLLAEHGREFRIRLLRGRPIKIGRIDAFRIETEADPGGNAVRSHMTFIPYRDLMYRIVGVAPRRVAGQYLGRTLNTARSFRPLSAEERNSIEILRLRIVEAQPGEDLSALGKRTQNAWDVHRTGVLNGIGVEDRFQGGERVKIARSERYVPEGLSKAEPPAAIALDGGEPGTPDSRLD